MPPGRPASTWVLISLSKMGENCAFPRVVNAFEDHKALSMLTASKQEKKAVALRHDAHGHLVSGIGS